MSWWAHPFFALGLKKVLPAILLNKMVFFAGYKVTDNPCIVDVGWVVDHFVAGTVYAVHFGALNTFGGKLAFGLLTLWAVRLAGHLFLHRIYPG